MTIYDVSPVMWIFPMAILIGIIVLIVGSIAISIVLTIRYAKKKDAENRALIERIAKMHEENESDKQ